MESTVLPKLAFNVLKEAKNNFQKNGHFSNADLEILHSFFGETLVLATELIENCKLYCYKTADQCRKVFKIVTKRGQYTIYNGINFCHCKTFHYKVLDSRSCLTCRHVLGAILGEIMGKVKEEIVTGTQLEEFYNEQLNYIDDV